MHLDDSKNVAEPTNVRLEHPWKRIYVLVFIKNSYQNQHLQSIKKMTDILKKESFFSLVDANNERSTREYQVAEPWRSRKRKAVSIFLEFKEKEFEVN